MHAPEVEGMTKWDELRCQLGTGHACKLSNDQHVALRVAQLRIASDAASTAFRAGHAETSHLFQPVLSNLLESFSPQEHAGGR